MARVAPEAADPEAGDLTAAVDPAAAVDLEWAADLARRRPRTSTV
jgi:hypothetical protein